MLAQHAGSVILAAAIVASSAGVVLTAPQAPSAAGAERGQAAEGADMYRGYCAPCHGMKGVGDGPVAAALKTEPTDLTRLAAQNRGQFPAQRVAMVLEFGVVVPAHGSTDMPTWGSTFRVMGDEITVRRRIAALTKHLESLQAR